MARCVDPAALASQSARLANGGQARAETRVFFLPPWHLTVDCRSGIRIGEEGGATTTNGVGPYVFAYTYDLAVSVRGALATMAFLVMRAARSMLTGPGTVTAWMREFVVPCTRRVPHFGGSIDFSDSIVISNQ